MRGLVGGIGNYRLYFRKSIRHTVIHFIKSHTVMYIAGGNDGLQDKAMLVTGGMGLIGKLPLVLPFTNKPLSGSVTLRVTVRSFSFFRRASFFFEVLSLRFFGGVGGSSSSSKGFFPWASRSALTSSISSWA